METIRVKKLQGWPDTGQERQKGEGRGLGKSAHHESNLKNIEVHKYHIYIERGSTKNVFNLKSLTLDT